MTRWYWLALNAKRATRGWMLRWRVTQGQAIVELTLILAIFAPVALLAIAVGYSVWIEGLTVVATQHAATMLAANPSADPGDEFTRAGCTSFTYTVTQLPGRVEVRSSCAWPSILGGTGQTSADRTAVLPGPVPSPAP